MSAAATASGAASRHVLGQSYLFLRVYADSMVLRVEITVDDLDRVLRFGWSTDAGVTDAQLQARIDSILKYVGPRLHVGVDGLPLPMRLARYEVADGGVADYVHLHYTIEGTATLPPRIEFGFPVLFEVDDEHRNLLVVEHNWRTGTFNEESNIALIFDPDRPRQTLDLSKSSLWRGFAAFVRLGAWHIWIGIDHILFLLALMFPSVLSWRAGAWEPVAGFRPALLKLIGIVTAFTVAHSLTLSLSALNLVRLPERPVEAVIALSIAAAALYNIYRPFAVREWMIAFAFGLFHGFGFANVLRELDLERSYLALSLLGFNLGVELGQIGIICLIFPMLFLLRGQRIYMPLLRYGSVLLIAIALVWFVERTFDVEITGYARRAPAHVYRQIIGA